MSRFMGKRRFYARRNLETCFPDRGPDEIEALLKRHFQSLGMSFFEMGLAWFGNQQTLMGRTHIGGQEHLEAALASGKGVILFTGHFTTLEVAGPTLQRLCPTLIAVYRPHRDPFMDAVFKRGRQRSAKITVAKDDIRGMVKGLRAGGVMWYAPDQSYRRKLAALLPFFSEPAMTNIATSQLSRMGKAIVIPFFPRRRSDNSGYELTFLPPVSDFPSDDPETDSLRLIALLEDHIRTCPEQYYWVHRRFKDRPAPLQDIYASE